MIENMFDSSAGLNAHSRIQREKNKKSPDDKFTFLRKLIEVREDSFRLVEPVKKKSPKRVLSKKKENFKFTDEFVQNFSLLLGQSKRSKSEGNLKLMVYKKGSKTWIVEHEGYPRFNKTIGKYPEMSLENARKKRDEILRGIRQ